MNVRAKQRLTVGEFLDWASTQEKGRYELVDGQIVAMSPERVRHNVTKALVWRALANAIKQADLPCVAFTDGMTIAIDEHRTREPDAAIQCGGTIDPDSVVLDAPLVVVEVVSPSSGRDDTGAKLVEYFSVSSIQHYLIVNPVDRATVHHWRAGADIRTRIVPGGTGELKLDPPGIQVAVADFFET